MVMSHHLFTGQCESVDECHVTNTLSAKANVMPVHGGCGPVKRHNVPRRMSVATSKAQERDVQEVR